MALEMNDLMMLRGIDSKEGLSPYEQYMVGYKQSKKPSGVAIAGLTVGVVGAVAGVTAWIFGPLYGNAKAGQAKEAAIAAKELASAQNQGLRDLVTTLAGTVAAERAERIAGDQTITQTVNDTVSGSQQGTLTAQQAAELSAVNSVMQQTYSDFVTGRASLNPTPVSLYSSPQPCACPASGCGCNG
ncbi:MAG: hypothetical protein IJT13_01470 [Bacteroidaceae bacterium]|nr:hypothetical protein [Bacteroidaceae bacterium]